MKINHQANLHSTSNMFNNLPCQDQASQPRSTNPNEINKRNVLSTTALNAVNNLHTPQCIARLSSRQKFKRPRVLKGGEGLRTLADKYQHVIRHPIICTFLASWKTNMEESSNGSDNGRLEKIVRKQTNKQTVFLLDEPTGHSDSGPEDGSDDHEYAIKEEMILVKGEFDLLTGADEQTIRQELKDLFRVKFPLISENDFDFVKRERNSIVTPVVKENHSWDYAHVKHLCGAGKLYVRLNVSKDVISKDMAGATSDDSDSSIPAMLPSANDRVVRPSTNTPTVIVNDVPSTSSGVSLMDDNISSLSELFPEAKICDIRGALIQYGSLELAAAHLSEKAVNQAYLDATEILKNLKLQMKGYGLAEKIKVDREDLLLDLFHYYKDSDFNPEFQIKIQFRKEPAIDTGGVLCQAYEDAFLALTKGDAGIQMFQGPPERLVPIYRSDNLLTGVFEVLGKIVAHSLIQSGPGFPFLAPSIYWYVATGDLQQGLARARVVDISDGILEGYVTRVRPCFLHKIYLEHLI